MKFNRFQTILTLLLLHSFAYANASHGIDNNIEQAVLTQVNQYRLSHGKPVFKTNPAITEVARKHSLAMANQRVPFGHKNFSNRINHLLTSVKGANAGAENVAYNYKNASAAVHGWLRSPAHKRNIDGKYDLTGVGIARDKTGKIFFTQIFLRTSKDKKIPARPRFRAIQYASK